MHYSRPFEIVVSFLPPLPRPPALSLSLSLSISMYVTVSLETLPDVNYTNSINVIHSRNWVFRVFHKDESTRLWHQTLWCVSGCPTRRPPIVAPHTIIAQWRWMYALIKHYIPALNSLSASIYTIIPYSLLSLSLSLSLSIYIYIYI